MHAGAYGCHAILFLSSADIIVCVCGGGGGGWIQIYPLHSCNYEHEIITEQCSKIHIV